VSVAAEKNRLRKKNEEQEKQKRREQKLNKRFHTAVALAYLKQLKLLESIYTNESPEKHLDRLFSSVSLKEKISSIKKEFFDSDNYFKLIMSILLHPINKGLFIRISNEVINRSFLRSSKYNALVFPCNDQPSLGYSFYRIIKRFSGSSKKAASEAATKIISENLPHSPKPTLPKTNLSNSVPSSPVSKEKPIGPTKPVTEPSNNKPQVSFVKNFNSITEKPEIISSGPINNNVTSTTTVTSVNDFKYPDISKRNYSYTVNEFNPKPSLQAAMNNPSITVSSGKTIIHSEIVKNYCSFPECNGIVCVGLCGKFAKGKSVGHITHGKSKPTEIDRTTVKISDKDLKGQNKQQNAVVYKSPHDTDISNQPKNIKATENLNNDLFALKAIDDAGTK
jgi:hypothetical protein